MEEIKITDLKYTPNVRQKSLTFEGVLLMSKYSHGFKLEVEKCFTYSTYFDI